MDKLVYGPVTVDLSDIEQIVEKGQVKGMGKALRIMQKKMDGRTTIPQLVEQMIAEIEQNGIDILDERHTGDLSMFRGIELASVLNRLRGMKIK